MPPPRVPPAYRCLSRKGFIVFFFCLSSPKYVVRFRGVKWIVDNKNNGFSFFFFFFFFDVFHGIIKKKNRHTSSRRDRSKRGSWGHKPGGEDQCWYPPQRPPPLVRKPLLRCRHGWSERLPRTLTKTERAAGDRSGFSPESLRIYLVGGGGALVRREGGRVF